MRISWLRSVSLLLVVLFTARASADWKQDYLKGVEKVKDRKYVEAIPLLTRALQAQRNSCNGCIRVGMFVSDYFPNYYLGEAYLATGQSDAALACFEKLQQEGLIQKNGALSGSFQGSFQMAHQQARSAAPSPPPEKPVTHPPQKPPENPVEPPTEKPPEKPPERPPARPPEPPAAKPGTPAPSKPVENPPGKPLGNAPDPQAVEHVRQKLASVENQLNTFSEAILQDYPYYRKFHERLRERLDQGRRKVESALRPKDVSDADWLVTRLQSDTARFSELFTQARAIRDLITALPENNLKPFPALHKEYVDLTSRLKEMRTQRREIKEDGDFEELLTSMGQIHDGLQGLSARYAEQQKAAQLASAQPPTPTPSTTSTPAAPAPPPPASPAVAASLIKNAFKAYFKGDFSTAEAALRSPELLNTGHPYYFLLKAILAGSQFLAEGEKDATLAQAAREAYRKAKSAGLPSKALSETYFSPKVIRLLEGK